ncbi:hypothetical protein GS597_06040 [Synechococcales cyanobacterium C]|uniref:Uncharacterized protein n=2 Tax=Petrachloros TaxID=2918834 RepID=A0A8K1ZYN7_9CYAN|nr:hypothetical protein [Petrachloros mirabilis ULC683]
MSDSPEPLPLDQATAEEVAEMITELEQYRERLVNDTLAMAQRAKVLRTTVMSNLEPDLARIDTMLQELRNRQATLTNQN